MRWTLALVPLLMFSGCLDAPSGDGPRTSDPGDGEPSSLRKGVVFYEADYQVLPNKPLEFDLLVPQGARNVRLEISVSGAATPLDEANVNLSGCGGARVSWGSGANANVVVSVSALSGSWREADLCERADPGDRTVTIDGGVTPLRGHVLLRADLP